MRICWRIFLMLLCLSMIFVGCGSQKPQIVIKTELGDIKVEIYEKEAPITASNFLRYIDENYFEEASFYRTVTMDNQPNNDVKIEVIQGGVSRSEGRHPPIKHETTDKTGILHKDGIISMARGKPGSATSEFFICVGDQPELDFGGRRNPDGQGFAAFGRVIDGMDVVRKIHRQPVNRQTMNPRIKIYNIVRGL